MTKKNEPGYGCIYRIKNLINGKVYIGQTSKKYVTARWGGHKCKARSGTNGYLYNAMRKYGEENFEFKVLIHNIPIGKLNFYEMLWIKKFNSKNPNGYNLTDGGEGTKGFMPWNKGKPRSKETIEKIKSHYTEEVREEFRKRNSGKNHPNYGKKFPRTQEEIESRYKKENNPFYGKHHNKETIIKQSNAKQHLKKSVAMCDIDTEEIIQIFSSYGEAGRYLRNNTEYIKADDSAISKCARGIYGHVYGYKWKQIEGVTTNCRDEIDTSRSA